MLYIIQIFNPIKNKNIWPPPPWTEFKYVFELMIEEIDFYSIYVILLHKLTVTQD